MPSTTVPLQVALSMLQQQDDQTAPWNPLYRSLARTASGPAAPGPGPEATAPRGSSVPETGRWVETVRRHVTAPAVIMLAVPEGASAHRLRLGLHSDGATLETSTGAGPSTWEELEAREAGRRLAAALPESLRSAAPELAQDAPARRLRPSPEQATRLADALRRGASMRAAVAELDGLDDSLRDLLLAETDRISLTLALRPQDSSAPAPGLTRLWVRGRHQLYRSDGPPRAVPDALPVPDGDVLATVLAVLQQALARAAAAEEAQR